MRAILRRFRAASPARRWVIRGAAAVAVALAFYGLLPLSNHKVVSFDLEGIHRGGSFSVGGSVLCGEGPIGFPFPARLTLPRRYPRNTAWELGSGALLVLPSTWMLCETAGERDLETPALPVLELYDPADGSGRGRIFLSNRVTTGAYSDLTIRRFDLRIEDGWVTRLDRRIFWNWYDRAGAVFDRGDLGYQNKQYRRTRHPALVPVVIDPEHAASLGDALSRMGVGGGRFSVIEPRCSEGRSYSWRVKRPDVERIYHMGILPRSAQEGAATDPELAAGIVPLVREGDYWRADAENRGALEMMPGFKTSDSNWLPAIIDWEGEVFQIEDQLGRLVFDRREGRFYSLGGKWSGRGHTGQTDCDSEIKD